MYSRDHIVSLSCNRKRGHMYDIVQPISEKMQCIPVGGVSRLTCSSLYPELPTMCARLISLSGNFMTKLERVAIGGILVDGGEWKWCW